MLINQSASTCAPGKTGKTRTCELDIPFRDFQQAFDAFQTGVCFYIKPKRQCVEMQPDQSIRLKVNYNKRSSLSLLSVLLFNMKYFVHYIFLSPFTYHTRSCLQSETVSRKNSVRGQPYVFTHGFTKRCSFPADILARDNTIKKNSSHRDINLIKIGTFSIIRRTAKNSSQVTGNVSSQRHKKLPL